MARQSSPGRQISGASLNSTTPAPAADKASAARLHRLKRIVGFAVGAGVFLSHEPVPIVGGTPTGLWHLQTIETVQTAEQSGCSRFAHGSISRISQCACSKSDQSSCTRIRQGSTRCVIQGSPRQEPMSSAGYFCTTKGAVLGGIMASVQSGTG